MPNLNSPYNEKPDPVQKSASFQEFSISRFHLFRHILVLILTSLLCFSLFMSSLNRYIQKHEFMLLNQQTIVMYLLLLLIVIFMAITAILSVRKVKISQETIELSNLFWHEKLDWSDLESMHSPKHLKFAWLKTKRRPYLLVKGEFKNYPELEYLVGKRIRIKN